MNETSLEIRITSPKRDLTPETAMRVAKGQEVTRAQLHPLSCTRRALGGGILMLGAGKGWGEEQFTAPQRDLSLTSSHPRHYLSLWLVWEETAREAVTLLICELCPSAPHTHTTDLLQSSCFCLLLPLSGGNASRRKRLPGHSSWQKQPWYHGGEDLSHISYDTVVPLS